MGGTELSRPRRVGVCEPERGKLSVSGVLRPDASSATRKRTLCLWNYTSKQGNRDVRTDGGKRDKSDDSEE